MRDPIKRTEDWCNIKDFLSGFYNTCDDKTYILQSSEVKDYMEAWPMPCVQDGLHRLSVR